MSSSESKSMKLRTMIILFIVLLVAVPDLLIGTFVYINVRSSAQNQLQDSTENSLRVLDKNLTQFIEGKTHMVSKLAEDLSGKKPETVKASLKSLQSADKDQAALYLANRKGDLIFLPDSVKIPSDLDPRTRPWYKLAMQHPGSAVITEPYVSSDASHAVTVTIAQTTADQSAVIGMDLKLSNVNDIVNQIKIGKAGYAYLLDKSNLWIANSRAKAGDKAASHLAQKFSGASSGNFVSGNKDIYFRTNKLTGWKIGGTMNTDEIQAVVTPVMVQLLVFAIVTIILISALVWFFVRRIMLKPVNRMVQVFEKMSRNDLSESVNENMRTSLEFSRLNRSINHTIKSLKEVVHTLAVKSEALAASSEELTASTEENKATTDEIAHSVQEIALAADQQSDSVKKLTDSAESINKSVASMQKSTDHLFKTTEESKQVVDQGQKTISTSAGQMEIIRQTVEQLSDMIHSLSSRSKEIGDIIDVIDDIADQTHLLSLNASIEAARAGENGKGFAVVAEEIQKLSAQSSESAHKISEIVTLIQKDTGQVVDSMDKGIVEVGKGMEAVKRSDASFDAIARFVNTVREQIKQVTEEIQKIAAATASSVESFRPIEDLAAQTSSNVQNVSAATEEQSASMEEIASSAASLSSIADELNQIVATFKTEKEK